MQQKPAAAQLSVRPIKALLTYNHTFKAQHNPTVAFHSPSFGRKADLCESKIHPKRKRKAILQPVDYVAGRQVEDDAVEVKWLRD